ncbi:MAG: hypothetical protein RLW61_04560 [Gammaproteobacteria bacterium]
MHIELFEHCGMLYCCTVEDEQTVLDAIAMAEADHEAAEPEHCRGCDYGNVPDYIWCAACGLHWSDDEHHEP